MMDKKTYNELRKKWENWIYDENQYFEKKKKLNRNNAPESEYEKLDKFYGHDGFNPRQFGPWTEIWDKEDLENPDFILPGFEVSFQNLTNTDKNIPNYFGKTITDDRGNSGIVCGYGYDRGDDYILARNEFGNVFTVMVNSRYNIKD